MSFVHTHTHSEHSRLDGLPSIEEMVQRAVDLGQPALAVSDHGVVSGHLKLQHAADKADIKPIFSMEGYFTDSRWVREGKKGEFYSHMTVHALNNKGLENLWTLSSLAFTEGLYYGDPRFDWELLTKYNEGLAITSGCMGGCVGSLLNPEHVNFEKAVERIGMFLKIFGDRFYMELHTYRADMQNKTNENVISVAQQYSVPLLAVSDSHYLKPEDWYLHEAVTAIGMNKKMDDPSRMQHGDNQLAIYSEDEVRTRLAYLPADVVGEAVQNTVDFAERCTARLKEELQMPVFYSTPAEDIKILKEKAAEGFTERIIDKLPETVHQEYFDRLDRELQIILDKGFAGYFLMVADTVGWSKNHGLLIGPSRGSAGGCLLAYCLGITELDPIPYGLIFERFLDLERESLPDIDLDFPDDERALTRAYLEDQYGATNIATIGTFDRVGLKTAIRDLCKVFEIPLADMDEVLKISAQHSEEDQTNGIWDAEFDFWKKKHPQLFQYLPQYTGHIRQSSSHAGGVVINKTSLLGKLPLYVSSPGDTELKIQFDMKDVESMGFVKMDHLGVRNLSTLMRTYKAVKERHPEVYLPHFYEWHEDPADLYNDQNVWDDICDGFNLGCFQIESAGIMAVTPRFRPRNIEDLAALCAAYRPGLLDAKDPDTGMSMFEVYMRRKEHRLHIKYPHPLLESVLKDTYGAFLYQEEVMKCCQVVAGYSMKEADRMRRIIGKKLPQEMAKERQIFTDGCFNTNGISLEEADKLFDELEAHQRYSFNKSHSVGYALVAYWCAYMKHYFPNEFMVALMQTDDHKNIVEHVRECNRLGIKVLGPDINESKIDFSLDTEGNIRYGLKYVKWGPSSMELERLQPYASMEDFVSKTTKQMINKRAVESLAKVGAFDNVLTKIDPLFSLQKNALIAFWEARGDWKKYDKPHKVTCLDCAGTKTEFECWADKEDLDNKVKHELELLGIVLSMDPLEDYLDVISEEQTFRPGVKYFRNERVRAGGLIVKSDTFIVKNGKNKGRPMGKILLQTAAFDGVESDTIDVMVFPDSYDKVKDDIAVGYPVFVTMGALESGYAIRDVIRLGR